MQLRVTVRDGVHRDVLLEAPGSTPWSVVADALMHSFPPAARGVWAGARRLPDAVALSALGLRDGAILELGRAGSSNTASGAVIRAHIVGGPSAGAVIGLTRGSTVIGRSEVCSIPVADAKLSRHHAVITVGPAGITVRDLGSTNGTTVDGQPVDSRGRPLTPGAHLRLGDTTISVITTDEPAAATRPGSDGTVLLTPAPRPAAVMTPALPLPVAPVHDRPYRVGLIAALVPALAGAAIAWAMHQPLYLVLSLASPVALGATALAGRYRSRRADAKHAAARLEFAARRAAALTAECVDRRRAHPDPAALLRSALLPDIRIWERRPDDRDFLDLRLGLGDRAASVPTDRAASVPFTVNLRDGPLGICGPRPIRVAIARWAVGQLAALHSAADLALVVLTDDRHSNDWAWTRWLPHLVGAEECIVQFGERRLLDHQAWSRPWLVLVVDRPTESIAGRLARLLELGPAAGITAIYLDEQRHRLPPTCVSTATVTGDLGAHLCIETVGGREDCVSDQVQSTWAETLSRALAPLRDARSGDSSAIPAACRLLDLLGPDPDSIDPITERWNQGGSPTATIGIGRDGPFEVDLARDGPHALIAGTTGAGKSELLRSLVIALALNCSPRDLSLILIDYKGGATFADCAALPHTVGLVTDLDANLTRRALRSLDAELRRRERLFSDAGVGDLSAYRAAAADNDQPLGRLVIVVDEFAALADESPQLLDALLAIAQRGRSLGIHLVLATQRPSGVVSPEIQANVALRIALRMTDPADSSAVIGSPAAAGIDGRRPGRAFVRIATTLHEVQTARIGGAGRGGADPINITVLDGWPHRARAELRAPDQPSELATAIELVRAAAAQGGYQRPPAPWLAPLPDRITRADCGAPVSAHQVAIGLIDRPDEQRQQPLLVDLEAGNSMLIAGPPGSGRTTALRSLATAVTGLGAQLYVIDCASGELAQLGLQLQCGAALGRDEPESIARLLARLADEAGRRRADATQQRAPIVVLLDGWEAFAALSDEYDPGALVDRLTALLRDASAVRLTIAIAGGRAALTNRAIASIERTFVLAPTGSEFAQLAGLRGSVDGSRVGLRALATGHPPGRALRTPDGSEVQFAIEPDVPDADTIRRHPIRPGLIQIRTLPSRVPAAERPADSDMPAGHIYLGLGGDAAEPVVLDLFAAALCLVAGPPRSGRSTTMSSILTQLHAHGLPTVVAARPQTPLADYAAQLGVAVLGPSSTNPPDIVAGRLAVLIDDVETFADSALTPFLLALTERGRDGMTATVVSGRSDELALTYHGLGAVIRRARTGILLQPSAIGGELLGVRIPPARSVARPGRGVLVCDQRQIQRLAPGQRAVPIQLADQPMCG